MSGAALSTSVGVTPKFGDNQGVVEMMNVVAVQADIEYRHQQLVREAKEYRRARQATAQSESAPKSRLTGLRGIRSHYRRAA